VVIIDIYMPQIDGIELIRVLRTRFPGMGIVAMTGRVRRVWGYSG
jgi:CheY-like chemotaxis protein